ncbi:MAG: AbrB/MazE/SpoVT family DNA-binding domain-containing protein [Candidatus Aenigmarchaeota archaeon]|nr:AbrB/MazE/SpoVT family DNA-binding domain-containing protein [Candidatus Aenigmarchaeota archaeon]
MPAIEVKTKKWGNSIGLLIPKDVVRKEKIRENQRLDIIILPKTKTLEKTFGMLKGWKINTQKALDELDRDEDA